MQRQKFNSILSGTSPRKAATVVGIAFFSSVFIVTLVDDFLLANFVVPGDTTALARDIEANQNIFLFAAIGYLVVLVLDSVIGLALYVVLKPTNKKLAALMSALRILYAGFLMVGVFALLFQFVDAFGYASIKLWGYMCFALHIFVLGYLVFVSGYIPKILGHWLKLASLTYVIFIIDIQLPETLLVLTMLVIVGAEIALSIWLLVRRNSLPENELLVNDTTE